MKLRLHWHCHPVKEKMKEGKREYIEDVLYQWFKSTRGMGAPISGPILLQKAEEIASKMNLDFTPNMSWIDRFKKRRGILRKAVSGEQASVDFTETQAQDWLESSLPGLLNDYSPENIYNANETELFFKCLQDRTLTFKGETCSDGKQ